MSLGKLREGKKRYVAVEDLRVDKTNYLYVKDDCIASPVKTQRETILVTRVSGGVELELPDSIRKLGDFKPRPRPCIPEEYHQLVMNFPRPR